MLSRALTSLAALSCIVVLAATAGCCCPCGPGLDTGGGFALAREVRAEAPAPALDDLGTTAMAR